ncbi:hypothetical protein QIG11_22970, partial [Klebsiella pneumoniae]|nr:hypothetical protein [Klebsiella pneumoniae]
STSKTPSYTKSVSWQHHHVYGYAISTQSMLFIIPLVAGIFLTLFSRRVSATNKHRDCSPQTNNGIHEHTETS